MGGQGKTNVPYTHCWMCRHLFCIFFLPFFLLILLIFFWPTNIFIYMCRHTWWWYYMPIIITRIISLFFFSACTLLFRNANSFEKEVSFQSHGWIFTISHEKDFEKKSLRKRKILDDRKKIFEIHQMSSFYLKCFYFLLLWTLVELFVSFLYFTQNIFFSFLLFEHKGEIVFNVLQCCKVQVQWSIENWSLETFTHFMECRLHFTKVLFFCENIWFDLRIERTCK